MGFFSWHSHIRQTDQPAFLSSLVTFRSRFTLLSILFLQKTAFVFGSRKHFGQRCQKQPSTKSVSFSFRNVKSGLPGRGRCLLHPVIFFPQKLYHFELGGLVPLRPDGLHVFAAYFVCLQAISLSGHG